MALLPSSRRPDLTFRQCVEFGLSWLMVSLLGSLPRNLSRAIGATIGAIAFRLLPSLRKRGERNLEIAYPEWTSGQRARLLASVYRNLGWLLAEFCLMPRYSREEAEQFVEYDGLEHYLHAREQGHGVLVLTGHLGAWELSSFFHSLAGYPMGMVIRRLDNSLVDRMVNQIRTLHGNRIISKDDFARGLIASMRRGETVGILMDTNMTPPQGVFAPFFGVPACTASGLAKVAQKTGAAVVPGFLFWEESRSKYILRFRERLPIASTGDTDADVLTNTTRFNAALEEAIRAYPEQWLWMHRRWKTRPDGEAALYQ